jgi:diketogulonate reductase-like aldo/keto reductase
MFGTGASFSKEYGTAYQVIDTAFSSGLYQFDTAPGYRTEEMLGSNLRRVPSQHVRQERGNANETDREF